MVCNDNNPCTDDTCTRPRAASTPTTTPTPALTATPATGRRRAWPVECVSGDGAGLQRQQSLYGRHLHPGHGLRLPPTTTPTPALTATPATGRCLCRWVCPGTALVCNDNNPCTDDTCTRPRAASTPTTTRNTCSDGSACTTNDTCSGGTCVGGAAPNCDDGNVCTDDTCNPATGCTHTNNIAPCSDGNACNGTGSCLAGVCQAGTALVCNDNNPCTDDTCAPTTGCVYTNDNTNSCSDGNICNGTETCLAGVCQAGTALVCNDNNLCTDDACAPATGCAHTNNVAPCNDGNACTTSDACSGGTCVGGAVSQLR